MFALFREGGVEQRARRLAVMEYVTWRRIATTDDLTALDIKAVLRTLEYWKAVGQLRYRCGRIAETSLAS
ncbi:hypothetical protein [Mycolicibacterium sp. A43C]